MRFRLITTLLVVVLASACSQQSMTSPAQLDEASRVLMAQCPLYVRDILIDGRPAGIPFIRPEHIARLDAASISTTSITEPSEIRMQASHSLHGSSAGPCTQLTALAKILAALVFPVPRGPLNK